MLETPHDVYKLLNDGVRLEMQPSQVTVELDRIDRLGVTHGTRSNPVKLFFQRGKSPGQFLPLLVTLQTRKRQALKIFACDGLREGVCDRRGRCVIGCRRRFGGGRRRCCSSPTRPLGAHAEERQRRNQQHGATAR